MKTIDFEIDKKEVLRYAGHKGEAPESLDSLAQSLIQECCTAINPKHIYSRFKISPVENGVMLENGLVLQGEDIKKHLDGCNECYILCATVGLGADGFIRTNTAHSSLQGLVADGRRTRAVESYCDAVEKDLRNRLKAENKFLTRRYSPGYGDFPFTQQPDILALLQTEKTIGVTCNQSCIMIPQKSVTAVMGIADQKPQGQGVKCHNCPNRNNCNFSCR